MNGRWLRRFRTAYISVARKNGKSELFAAIGLALLVLCGEAGAEIYSAATKRDQAAICWRAAARMARKDAELRRDFLVTDSRHIIAYPGTDSTFVALGADADTMDGLSPLAAIVDELHAHKTGDTWDVLKSGMGARAEPMQIAVTTAGGKRAGVCWEVEQDAVRALESTIEDDSLFGFIARLDDADDWSDESVWRKANPNLGVSVHLDHLRMQAKTAQNNPSRLAEVKRKNFNLWTDVATIWLPIERWDSCAAEIDWDERRGLPCWVAVDLSATRDTTAVVAAFPRDGGIVEVLSRVFIPADTVEERTPRERDMFRAWVAEGLITATEGDMVDYDAVWLWILNLAERYEVREVIFDRWQSASLIARAEQYGLQTVGFGQGFKDMSPAVKLAETMIGRRRLRHDGSPVLRWMVSNVAVQRDAAGNVKPHKERSASRIDAAVAMFMAVTRAVACDSGASEGPRVIALEA